MAYRVRDRAAVDRARPFTLRDSFGVPASARAEFSAGGTAGPGPCPEIDCLRGLIAADVIAAAERRAEKIGVGADRVLIAAGAVSEETYLRKFAAALGLVFETLDGTARAQCPIGDDRQIEAAAAGLLPLALDGELCLVVSPRGMAARRIIQLIKEKPTLTRKFRLTSAERLTRFVFRYGGKRIGARAVNQLNTVWPALSAAPARWRVNIAAVAAVGLAVLTALAMAPAPTMLASEVMLATVFLAWLALRLFGATVAWPTPNPPFELHDDALPVYTIIAALYREAASVDGLLAAIERFDYPREKLNVILVTEADDQETRVAISARKNRIPVEILIAPPAGPRTKPKALNVALPFARGSFTVIYDAEDRPESNQLRRALQAFCAAGDDLACVQACLSIDNTADSWLTRGIMAQTPQAAS